MRSALCCAWLAALLGLAIGTIEDAAAVPGDRWLVIRTNVNVRSGPSLNDGVVMTINPGEEIVEIRSEGEWFYLDFPNRNAKGWIYGPLLDAPVVTSANTASSDVSAPITAAPEPSAAAPLATTTEVPNQVTERAPAAPQTRELAARDPASRFDDARQRKVSRYDPGKNQTFTDGKSWLKGDPASGAKVFYKCGSCHSTERGINSIGPSLWGIVDSAPAQVPGFGYSAGMRKFAANGAVWDEETLDEFIRRPPRLVRGTSMPFSGIRSEKERRDLIAFLRKHGGNKYGKPTAARLTSNR